jgi:hypothetical protein
MVNLDQHIENKIRGTSDDELVARVLTEASSLLQEIGAEYAVVGSCAVQSYLPHFYRLPNDLDIVLRDQDTEVVRRVGADRGYEFRDQLGRTRLFIRGFPVHLIPHHMNIIDKSTSTVFTRIDLGACVAAASRRPILLLGTSLRPTLRIISLEAAVFIELIRPVYTGSLTTIAFVLRHCGLEVEQLAELLRSNDAIRPIIEARFEQYLARFDNLALFEAEERAVITTRFKELAETLRSA